MRRALRWFRELPLRSRLALLVATAVTVAVAAVAAACWFITQGVLTSQLDNRLRNQAASSASEEYANVLIQTCQSPNPKPIRLPGNTPLTQLVFPDGTVCANPRSAQLQVERSDVEVASGLRPDVLHTTTDSAGVERRVYTKAARITGPGQQSRAAVSIAVPMSDVTTPLNKLAIVLLVVSGIGVIGAGAAGLWVARTGLRPVDELAGTVEHVARTEDLTVRIPVEGEDEIARLSRSFNAMTAALASSRDRQSQLIADAGHELRTPLTSLRTNIELLARSEETGRAIPPADRKALMASVKAQMTELASLIGDLQELSRPDAVRAGPLEVVAFHDIARVALDRARLRGPELEIRAELAPWYVRAEAASLERAIVNVLDNAVKFSPPHGTVEVTLDRGALTVRDQGPGIPADELPHVFERFWRSPSARSLPGSGLGLSIVARTVQHAGGTITLGAAPDGGGTVATIRLPGAPTPPPSGTGA
ncbi:sensor histidine kinase [Streptomyces melanogenes]|uniref:histidine kinase n=1 Tax=Streptomyces melanogenes TaxID=67326 RepID=A0ABZ1XM61_9ACTN|nr:HAMP domain-containing sensor histidine kinase [Streptomyces melanogenes]